MPSTAALELAVKLKDQASKGLDDIADKGGGLGRVMGALISPIGLVTGAVAGLGGGLVLAAKAAADEQVGMVRLNQTLKNSIPNWDGNTDAVEAYIAKQQRLAFSDDELRDSLNQLVGQTHDLREAQELQATAMDLARAKGMDLQTATKLVGKVDQDNIGILKRYGIVVDENATKEEALSAIRAQSAGQAEAYANTTAGSMERIQNAFGDALEDIGGAILPQLEVGLRGLADFISSPEFQAGFQKFVELVGSGIAFAVDLVGNIIRTVTPLVEGLVTAFTTGDLTPFRDALENLPGPLGVVGKGLSDVIGATSEFFAGLSGNPVPAFTGSINTFNKALAEGKAPADAFTEAISKLDLTDIGKADALKAFNEELASGKDPATAYANALNTVAEKTQNAGRSADEAKAQMHDFWYRLGQDTQEFQNKNREAWFDFIQVQPKPGETPAEAFWAKMQVDIGAFQDKNRSAWYDFLQVQPRPGETPADIFWARMTTEIGAFQERNRAAWFDFLQVQPKPGETPADVFWTNMTTDIATFQEQNRAAWFDFIGVQPKPGETPAEVFWQKMTTDIAEFQAENRSAWFDFLNVQPKAGQTPAEAFWNKMTTEIRDFQNRGRQAWDSVGDGIQNAINSVKGFIKTLQTALEIIRIIIREAAKIVIGGGGGGGGGNGPNMPGMAVGGPVAANRAYIVGENGPELFMSGSSGTIIPNNRLRGLAGGGGITIVVNAGMVADENAIIRAVEEAIASRNPQAGRRRR